MSEIQNHVIDPVCGMTIGRADAMRIVQDGITYHFCDVACADTFREDPERWVIGFEHGHHSRASAGRPQIAR